MITLFFWEGEREKSEQASTENGGINIVYRFLFVDFECKWFKYSFIWSTQNPNISFKRQSHLHIMRLDIQIRRTIKIVFKLKGIRSIIAVLEWAFNWLKLVINFAFVNSIEWNKMIFTYMVLELFCMETPHDSRLHDGFLYQSYFCTIFFVVT